MSQPSPGRVAYSSIGFSIPLDKAGCPTFRGLCERWDSRLFALPTKSWDDERTPCICLGYLDILGMFRLRAEDFREAAKYLLGAALNMTSLRRHRLSFER